MNNENKQTQTTKDATHYVNTFTGRNGDTIGYLMGRENKDAGAICFFVDSEVIEPKPNKIYEVSLKGRTGPQQQYLLVQAIKEGAPDPKEVNLEAIDPRSHGHLPSFRTKVRANSRGSGHVHIPKSLFPAYSNVVDKTVRVTIEVI